MVDDLWILVAFAAVLCVGLAVAFVEGRCASRAAARKASTRPDIKGAAGALDVARVERQLGMLLRRMRAYRRAPYDFASSRIGNGGEFERCLDLATALGLHIGELSAPASPRRESASASGTRSCRVYRARVNLHLPP